MLNIRTVKTKDKCHFVQLYRYENGNQVIVKAYWIWQNRYDI